MAVTRQTLNVVGMGDLDTWHEQRIQIISAIFAPDNIHMIKVEEARRGGCSKTR